MSLDKLLKLKKDFNENYDEFIRCRQKIILVDQFKFPISERIKETNKLLDKCWEIKNAKLDNILNSDIDLHKYKKIDVNNNISLNWDQINKDRITELAKKHNNKMLSEYELEEIAKTYSLERLDEIFTHQYIKKMMENEIKYNGSIRCIDEKILSKYNKLYEDFSSNTVYHIKDADQKILIDETIKNYPHLNFYPNHQEYLQCSFERNKANFKLH